MMRDIHEPLTAAPADSSARATERRRLLQRTLDAMRSAATLSQILRIAGALVILASMSVFLLQGWHEGNDVRRYLRLLAQTGLLTAAGLAMTYVLRENRSARVFHGLALASISANFTVLGALIYSALPWDGALTVYPDFASWQLSGAAGAGLTLAGALVVLAPVVAFSLAVLVRPCARDVFGHFMLMNALLLIPLRDSLGVGIIVLGGLCYALYAARSLRARHNALATSEGMYVLALLFVPVVIAAIRSLTFYSVDELLLGVLGLGLFLGLRHTSLAAHGSERLAASLDVLALPVALGTALSFASSLDGVVSPVLQAPAFALLFAAGGFEVAGRTRSRSVALLAAAMVGLLSSAAVVMNALFYTGAVSAFIALAFGAALFAVGRRLDNGFVRFVAVVTALAGVLGGGEALIDLIGRAGSLELALIGAAAIALAALLERHGAALRLRIGKVLGRSADSEPRE